jgi:hypothetical protein
VDLTALVFDVREEVSRIANQAGYDQRPAYYDETIGSAFDQFAAARITELKKKQQIAVVVPPVPPAVPAPESSPLNTRRFDGTWQGNLTCQATPQGSPGWQYEFIGHVSNGRFHGERGIVGRPFSQTFDGKSNRTVA